MADRKYEAGRSTEGYCKGPQIKDISGFKLGEAVIGISNQFEAENLYRVIAPFGNEEFTRDKAYLIYIDTNGTTINGAEKDIHAVWGFELQDENPTQEFFESFPEINWEEAPSYEQLYEAYLYAKAIKEPHDRDLRALFLAMNHPQSRSTRHHMMHTILKMLKEKYQLDADHPI
jgi:hypothetical protein